MSDSGSGGLAVERHSRVVPVTSAQRRMYFASIMRPDDSAEVWGTGFEVAGDLAIDRLERALKLLYGRHDALRSGFLERDGAVLQVVPDADDGAARPLIEVVEADGDSPGERRTWAHAEARRLIDVPFDISSGPLWRTTVIRVSPGLHLVVFVFHHLIIDDITMQVFAEELRLAYADPGAPVFAVPAVQYSDFCLMENGSQVDREGLDYWRDRLAGVRPIRLPEDGGSPDGIAGRRLPVPLSQNETAEFEAFCKARSVTPFAGMLAVYFILLQRWTGAGDITVGTPVLSRPHSTLFRTIGFFANTVVLRCPAAPALTFDTFLGLVSETVRDTLDYQDVPFDVVVDALAPERDADRNPLFQAAIAYGTLDPGDAWVLDGLQVTPVPELAEMSGLQFDLTLDIRPFAGKFGIAVLYNRRRFSDAVMRRFAEAYGSLLRSLSQAPDVPLGSIPLLDRAALAETLTLGAGGERQDSSGLAECTSAWDLFAGTAAATPEREAVDAGGERLTFAELADRARRMAAGLRARGVRTGTVVGICLPRRCDLVAAMLATWCAGGAFVLLDQQQPEDHRLLLDEAGAALVVADESFVDAETVSAAELLADAALAEQESAGDIDVGRRPAVAPAYVVFTSRSIGQPKGVVIDQAGLVAFATTQLAPRYARLPDDRPVNVGGLSSVTSDVFVSQCLGMIGFGHRLLLIDDEERADPVRLVGRGSDSESAIDVLDCASSQLEILVDAGLLDAPHPPKILVIDGAQASDRLWQRLRDRPGLLAFNVYGVAECTVASTMVEIRDQPEPVAGRAVGASRLYIVDDQVQLLPPLFVGEVCIGGLGVGQGYVGQPAYTSQRFVADPFSRVPGQRMYRTGRKGRLRPDGQLEFLDKPDSRALPADKPSGIEPAADRGVATPAVSRTEQLRRIVAEVVGVPEAGLDDNFFALGGSSLLAMQVVSRVLSALGCELSVRTIFESETIGQLAAQLDAVNSTPRLTLRRRENS